MSANEESLLAQFKELTAYPEEKHEQVLLLLEQCHWDLNVACGRYFDNQLPSLPTLDQPMMSEQLHQSISQQVDLPIPLRSQHVNILFPRAIPISTKWKFNPGIVNQPSPFYLVLLFVPKMLFWLVSKLGGLLGIVNLDPENVEYLPSTPLIGGSQQFNVEAEVKMALKLTDKEFKLPVWTGEFNDAFKMAKNEHQWLLTVLVNIPPQETGPVTKETKMFLEILLTKGFKDFLNRHNIILYLGNVAHAESHLVAKTYQVKKLPYVSLIASMESNDFCLIKHWNDIMNTLILGSQQNTVNKLASKLVNKLDRIIEFHDPNLVVLRSEKQQRDLARILREEQDRQFEETLARDRELARQRELEKELKEKELEQQRLIQKKKEGEKAKLKNRRHLILSTFIKKHLSAEKDSSDSKHTRIQFRKPDGTKFIHKFYETQSARDIFEHIAALEYVYEMTSDEKSKEDIIEDICSSVDELIDTDEFEFEFELISPMPRLKLTPSNDLLQEIKELWPNGSLIIEKIIDDSNDEYEDEDESS